MHRRSTDRCPPRLRPAGIAVVVLVLTGCTGGSVLGILDTEQTERDLPGIRTDLDGVDLASTRFLAERDGIVYFAAVPEGGSGAEDSTVCLLVEEGIGVGLECAPLERGSTGAVIRDSLVTAVLLPDDIDRNAVVDEGFELLHPNLAIRAADAG